MKKKKSHPLDEPIENDDWELFKKCFNYNDQPPYYKDSIRLMFESAKLKHNGASPQEVLMYRLMGLLKIARKHNLDESLLMKAIAERTTQFNR